MPRKAVDYNKTIIYKLVKNDDYDNENIYVGSTTDFIRRKYEHKASCCNENNKLYNFKVYQIIRENGGWGEWNMIEIEKFPCNDNNEAHAREEYWRCEFNARLNTNRAFRTKEVIKEHKNQYYTKNIDKIKEYRTENAEKIKKQSKQYYIEHAEEIKQYQTENAEKIKEHHKKYRTEHAEKLHKKYECDCGGKYTHQNKLQHFKSKKHQNYLNNKVETI